MKTWITRFAWMATGIAALYGMAALAGVASGGSLDPPGTPASTMQSLNDIPGPWFRHLSSNAACSSERFSCQGAGPLGEAVLDRETGLVWQQTPFTATATWLAAMEDCWEAHIDARRGWRLARLSELSTLFTLSALPVGHPFGGFVDLEGIYWTSTTVPTDSSKAYYMDFAFIGTATSAAKSGLARAWCVRGPADIEGQ